MFAVNIPMLEMEGNSKDVGEFDKKSSSHCAKIGIINGAPNTPTAVPFMPT